MRPRLIAASISMVAFASCGGAVVVSSSTDQADSGVTSPSSKDAAAAATTAVRDAGKREASVAPLPPDEASVGDDDGVLDESRIGALCPSGAAGGVDCPDDQMCAYVSSIDPKITEAHCLPQPPCSIVHCPGCVVAESYPAQIYCK